MARWMVTALIAIVGQLAAPAVAGPAASKFQTVQIFAGSVQNEFAFTPGEVTVPVEQPVKLTVTNRGKVDHDFHIEAIGVTIRSLIPSGKSATVDFTPTKRGSFEFFCEVSGHKEAGMKGAFIVR